MAATIEAFLGKAPSRLWDMSQGLQAHAANGLQSAPLPPHMAFPRCAWGYSQGLSNAALGGRLLSAQVDPTFSHALAAVNPISSTPAGAMVITATKSKAVFPYSWVSGQLCWHSQQVPALGMFEARITLSHVGNGIWPAFWALDESGAWPPELDVFEGSKLDAYCTFHDASLAGGQSATNVGPYAAGQAIRWGWYNDGATMTWLRDRKPVKTMPSLASFNSRMLYPILDLCIGNASSWPGAPDATAPNTITMTTDYVAYWSH